MRVPGYARVLAFLHVHRKSVTILAIVATVLLAANISLVLAFHQSSEVDGVRVATDREAYGVGQTVKVTLYLVNKLDQAFDTCVSSRDVFFKGPFGTGDGIGTSILYTQDPHCGNIQPGSERLEAVLDQWRPLLPGIYDIQVGMTTVDPSFPVFRGNANILVVPLA